MVAVGGVDVSDVVVLTASWANTATHQLLQQDVLSIEEVNNEVHLETGVTEELGLGDGARHSVEDDAHVLGVVGLGLHVLEDIDYEIVINKLPRTENLLQIDNEFVVGVSVRVLH